MKSITHVELAWELYRAGINPSIIADRLNCHRATVFRWIKEIKRLGINEFVVRKKTVKRRRQPRKLKNELVGLVCTIRSNYDWCGEKIKKELLVKTTVSG